MARKNKEPKVKSVKQKNTAESKTMRIIGNPVRVLLIMAVISLLFGVALVKFYETYYKYFDFIVGGIVALIGVVNIVFYFCKKTIDGVFRSEFAIGIFCMAVGAYVALNGGVSFPFLVVIGALLTLDGIIKLQYTLDLLRMRYKKWWLVLIFALLGIVIGIVLLMDLLKDIFETESVTYTGLVVCLNAVLDIIVAVIIGIRNRRALKAAAAAPVVAEAPVELPVEAKNEPEIEVEVFEEAEAEMAEAAEETVPEQPEDENAVEAPAEEPAVDEAEDAPAPEAEASAAEEPTEEIGEE